MTNGRSREFRAPSSDDRRRWLDELGDPDAHRRIARDLDCLYTTDVEPTPHPEVASGWLRVAAWNIERGRNPEEIAALIGATGASVTLLSEVDLGMARTGNRDTARELARMLRAGSVFGVEYVELSLGKAADLEHLEARDNECGLHGNAILGRVALERPDVARFDEGGGWFNDVLGEPRVGGQLAVVATMQLDGVAVELASAHLESHSDAESRARQLKMLVESIDARSTGPAIIGGDLNTFGATFAELADHATTAALRASDPARFSWPAPYEPLFEVARNHGYEWLHANVAAPTTRHRPDGSPHHIPLKLDWILVRGLEARRSTTAPAIGRDGAPLSDHDLVAVSVRVPQGRP